MKLLKSLVLVLLLASSGAHAVLSQGTTGTTSTGTLDIDLVKNNNVRISNLSDIDFGTTAVVPTEQFISLCVYSTTGGYSLTASSEHGTGTDFRLANAGDSDFITYNVLFNDADTGAIGDATDLNHTTPLTTQTGANTTSDTCGGGTNSRLFVDIDATSFGNAGADTFADVLTLTVAPE